MRIFQLTWKVAGLGVTAFLELAWTRGQLSLEPQPPPPTPTPPLQPLRFRRGAGGLGMFGYEKSTSEVYAQFIGVLFGCFGRKIDGFRFLVYLVV